MSTEPEPSGPSRESQANPDPLLYERAQAPAPSEPTRVEVAVETTAKVAVGCLSCVALIAAAIGALLGLGGGALYHTLLAPEGHLWLHLVAGALLGFLVGVRTVVPIEEILFDWFEDRVLGGGGPSQRRRRRR